MPPLLGLLVAHVCVRAISFLLWIVPVEVLLRCGETRVEEPDRRSELVFQLQPPGVVGVGIGQVAEDAEAGHQRGVLADDVGRRRSRANCSRRRSAGWDIIVPPGQSCRTGWSSAGTRRRTAACRTAGWQRCLQSWLVYLSLNPRKPRFGRLALAQAGREDQRLAKECLGQGLRRREGEVHAVIVGVADRGQCCRPTCC